MNASTTTLKSEVLRIAVPAAERELGNVSVAAAAKVSKTIAGAVAAQPAWASRPEKRGSGI